MTTINEPGTPVLLKQYVFFGRQWGIVSNNILCIEEW